MWNTRLILVLFGSIWAFSAYAGESKLPGTDAFTMSSDEDRSAKVLKGLHRFVDRYQSQQIEAQPMRWSSWSLDVKRQKLRAMLGADLKVSASELSWRDSSSDSSILAENQKVTVRKVTWKVLDTYAGEVFAEGLWVKPRSVEAKEVKLVIPDADQSPESFLGLADSKALHSEWLKGSHELLVMRLVNRDHRFSFSEPLQRQVLVNHREWIHRQSFGLGRTLTGYEVLSVEAAIEAIKKHANGQKTSVEGYGEGARIALFAAALRDEVVQCDLHGGFGPQDRIWSETLDRNLQGYLKDFGDAAVASLIAPRKLVIHEEKAPIVPEVPLQKTLRLWAPGAYRNFSSEEIQLEIEKAKALAKQDVSWLEKAELSQNRAASQGKTELNSKVEDSVQASQQRLVKQWSQVSQRAVREMELERNAFWRKLVANTKLENYEKKVEPLRVELWEQVLGRLPDPQAEAKPKSALLYETEKVRVYELWLEVAPDVALWSWVGIPKNLKGAKAPVVVCQHGLEGLPEHVFTTDPQSRYSQVYKSYALTLAEKGYVTVAPHMPYRGEDEFRLLQRKLNASGLTLYSVAIQQHQQLIAWLKAQPYVDASNIGLYGLSYGGKIAMRIPAILKDYKFSICSGDFNEWIMKLTNDSFPASYIFTKEYEIWEWNLAERFNHSEMGLLIAPRSFMVEYGHRDGVSASEWVGYEYGKIKRLYDTLAISERTRIAWFDGPHAIDGNETFEFIEREFDRK